MNNDEFESFLIQTIENDKANIHMNENPFATFCANINKQHKNEQRREKILSRGVLPIMLATIVINIYFLFSNAQNSQTMTTFAEENFINTSAYYFSEVLINE